MKKEASHQADQHAENKTDLHKSVSDVKDTKYNGS